MYNVLVSTETYWQKFKHAATPSVGYYLELIIALVLFVQGFYALVPAYDLPRDSVFGLDRLPMAQNGLGILLIVSSILLFWGLSQHHFPTRRAFRRAGSFLAFGVLLFITFLGILSEDVNDIYWISTLGIAIMTAVMYVRVGWQLE